MREAQRRLVVGLEDDDLVVDLATVQFEFEFESFPFGHTPLGLRELAEGDESTLWAVVLQ